MKQIFKYLKKSTSCQKANISISQILFFSLDCPALKMCLKRIYFSRLTDVQTPRSFTCSMFNYLNVYVYNLQFTKYGKGLTCTSVNEHFKIRLLLEFEFLPKGRCFYLYFRKTGSSSTQEPLQILHSLQLIPMMQMTRTTKDATPTEKDVKAPNL